MDLIITVPANSSIQEIRDAFQAADKAGRMIVKVFIENPTAEDQAIATKRPEPKEGWIPTGDVG